MFSAAKPPHQILLCVAFRFLCNPKLSLMSSSLGLKESVGRLVTELGRSRAPHQTEATIGRRRGPPCGKANAESRRPELPEKNRQKSGPAPDTPFGGGGNQKRGRQAERPPSRPAAKASKPPCGAAKEYC